MPTDFDRWLTTDPREPSPAEQRAFEAWAEQQAEMNGDEPISQAAYAELWDRWQDERPADRWEALGIDTREERDAYLETRP